VTLDLPTKRRFEAVSGRREEALTAITEAVEYYRALAQAHPDAFLSNLAMSLKNQAGRLADLGRREDALIARREAELITL
jgi:hypothetical protein